MLFSHWPLAYIILTNTEICKKAENFRKSSIFTIMNIFFIFGSDKEKWWRPIFHTLNHLIGSLSLLVMQISFTRNMSNIFRNDKCGRGKRQAASDKQQPEILISNFGQIWTMLLGHWPLGYMNTIICKKSENRQGSQFLTIFYFCW